MFFLYLRRELGKRKRQSLVVASGLAIAIGLSVVVQAASAGVGEAQTQVLQSMYGIGTDVAITKTSTAEFGPQRFEIGGGAGRTEGESRTFSRSRLRVMPGSDTLTATEMQKVASISGVRTVTGTLRMTSVTFNGELPTFMQQGNSGQQTQGDQGMLAPMPTDSANAQGGSSGTQGVVPAAPQGGFDGRGGSAFDITSFSVEGVDPAQTAVGPLSSTAVLKGRALAATDNNADVALVDATYATSAKFAVGDTLTVAGETVTIVGVVQSTSAEGSASSNVFIPLATAQRLSGISGVTNVYVSATDAGNVSAVTAAIESALPDATVNSSANLADSITGSLATATSLVGNLGKWLSIIVLLAAFLIAMLLTSSGVQRRTREFGTLKAIGWRSSRIVRQVVGESLVTGALGGVLGLAVGGAGILAVNHFAPALSATQASSNPFAQAMPGGGMRGPGGGPFGELASAATNSASVTLHAALSVQTVVLAFALALLGGVLAGAFGGWRAARLRPAEALRSVA